MDLFNKIEDLDDIILMRCIIKKDCGDYFKAEDYNGRKYIIAKNRTSKNFKRGTDDTFYAYKESVGMLFKKEIYYPVSSDEYFKLKDIFEEKQ
ncbi:hypothetical protein [Clostridium sp. YIM B02551]|uniref:hypothetical protein n=1 Tax=Clostridium sp. YIM B02551 TaxID=2910679 RepID=UPI001EEBFF81|nr:hypothetical protein [Clostridium sp. YIM B02551]